MVDMQKKKPNQTEPYMLSLEVEGLFQINHDFFVLFVHLIICHDNHYSVVSCWYVHFRTNSLFSTKKKTLK